MSLASIQEAARCHADAFEALTEKLILSGDYSHIPPDRRERMLGPRPEWAYFVLGLSSTGAPTEADEISIRATLGDPHTMRACAMRILEVADRVERESL